MSAPVCPICKGTKVLAGYTSRSCANCDGAGIARHFNAAHVLGQQVCSINGLTLLHFACLDLSPKGGNR